jgi:short subunit dehydrogenase-like uncharacterized protein
MAEREYDLVLLGATGFTGRLVAEYLLEQYGVDGDLRWAIAGRSAGKLEALRRELGAEGDAALPMLVADNQDTASLQALVRQTGVVCSTVGPYARYGTPLVEACADSGTHYCDLTGEVPWIASNIANFQDRAEASGARIVHCCGFDSIPSDLGTWFVQRAMQEQHGVVAHRVRGRVGRTRGGASGGTVASLLGVLEDAQGDAALRRQLRDKYLLYPAGEAPGPAQRDQLGASYDPRFERWTCPFVMALINERVVRRSNALLGFPWGRDFNYDEAQLCSSRGQALMISAAMGAAMLTASSGPGRRLVARLLPKPGEGPDRQSRENGCFELFFHAEHPRDRSLDLRARVAGDRDPGYGATSRMLGEAAACLALDDLSVAGGIWTPASALAEALLPRLETNAGLQFQLLQEY